MNEIETLRHSCAHILANAMLHIWPEIQFAAGPPVTHGFYYDFELNDHQITPNDFQQIEEKMKQIVSAKEPFQKIFVTRDEAITLAQNGELGAVSSRKIPSYFKLDIIQRIPLDQEITLYRNGDFLDLCSGPHVEHTGVVQSFRLTHLSSTFYQGNKANKQLQRIYGTAFYTIAELDKWFELLAESKKRDHRKIGKELDLFHIDDSVGSGLILWTPKGAIVRQQMQNFLTDELSKQGYLQVFTPHIANLELFRQSGHFPYYADSQFPPLIDYQDLIQDSDEKMSCAELCHRIADGSVNGYLLKPMNCPLHIKIFSSKKRSYRELPIRLAEFGTVYRWEQSGELQGLTRVRGFTQDDAHLFVTEEQLLDELISCLELVKKVFGLFQMDNYRVRIGLRDNSLDKYVGDEYFWKIAENACREAAKTLDIPFTEQIGEAAFYGPKIDFVVSDVLFREWQLGTVQVDFNLPRRFQLCYIGSDGKEHIPVMIHRAPFGSLERFFGLLIEHFNGHFPLWLSPEQVRVIPVSEKTSHYAQTLVKQMLQNNIRVTSDLSSGKLGAKIRLAQLEKIPYMLVVGTQEESLQQVSVRSTSQGNEGVMPFPYFLEKVLAKIDKKSL